MELTYSLAVALRTEAERGCDPDKYQMAAAEFTALGMTAAAQACTARARHYQQMGFVEIPMKVQFVTGEEITV
jgi:hypothetical protein